MAEGWRLVGEADAAKKFLAIRDTRACAVAPQYELEGRAAILLRALESRAAVAGLYSPLASADWPDSETGDG